MQRYFSWIIAALAILLYVNTIGHDFVLDDQVVIRQNTFVQQGLSGWGQIFTHDSFEGYLRQIGYGGNVLDGGRFRPLSLAVFALIWQFFKGQPLPYHLLSLIMYALNGILIYRVMVSWLSRHLAADSVKWSSFAAALLFVAHPVHTEVAANIKSCDEQMALLFGLLSWLIAGHSTAGWGSRAGLLATSLLACLSKENALAFILLLPVLIYVSGASGWADALRRSWPALVAAGVFLMWRYAVIGDVGGSMMHDPLNNPFLKSDGKHWIPFSTPEKYSTILWCLGQYMRLLVWPQPLTHDYYPFQIEPPGWANLWVITSVAAYAALIVFTIRGIIKKQAAAIGTGLFLVGILPVSNLLFPVGVFMAERFLFLPGFGLIWALATLPWWHKTPVKAGLVGLIFIFGVLTINRNKAWASNEILYRTDMAVSAKSVKIRANLGYLLISEAIAETNPQQKKAKLEEGWQLMSSAVQVHPTYWEAWQGLAASSFFLERYEDAVSAYSTMVRINPQDQMAKVNLANALHAAGNAAQKQGNTDGAIRYWKQSLSIQPDSIVSRKLLDIQTAVKD